MASNALLVSQCLSRRRILAYDVEWSVQEAGGTNIVTLSNTCGLCDGEGAGMAVTAEARQAMEAQKAELEEICIFQAEGM